jgi:DNA gyrase subunit B
VLTLGHRRGAWAGPNLRPGATRRAGAADPDGLHRVTTARGEQAAIAGALTRSDAKPKQGPKPAIYRPRLTSCRRTERGWTGLFDEYRGLVFERMVRGVSEVHIIDPALIASADARRLDAHDASLQSVYREPATLRRKGVETPVYGPRDLLEAIFAVGRKGIAMQRYKGLGEMNPNQLWETTLDPDVRSLLQVKVREADEADDIFTKLMGDEVEPRREFIQANALSVANLDV